MKRHTSVAFGIILGVVAALGFAADASAQELREEFHQTYALAANGSVSLRNLSGAVHISTWAQNAVKVDAIKTARNQERLQEAKIEVENTPDRVVIRTKYPDRNWDRDSDDDGDHDGRSLASVEYNLTIPAGASIDEVKLVSGDVDVKGVGGDVRISSVSGSVNAEGLKGRAEISSVSGDVKVTFNRASSRMKLNSVSGDIIAMLPTDASVEVSANTVSGDISNEFGLDVDHGKYVGHHLTGQIGNGEGKLELHSVSGEIKVRRASL
jgi:Putative adhesin